METERKGRTLWTLFASMLSISACTFGGGFVIVTFMRRRFVEELHWLAEDEMLDLIALAQSSPGAIAVNAAILVGWRIGGFAGMLAAAVSGYLAIRWLLRLLERASLRAFAYYTAAVGLLVLCDQLFAGRFFERIVF